MCYGVVLFFLALARRQFNDQVEINRLASETDRKILDIIENLNRVTDSLANDLRVTNETLALVIESQRLQGRLGELERRRSGALPRALAAIKNWFGSDSAK